FLRPLVNLPRLTNMRVARVRKLLDRRHNRLLRLQNHFDLRHDFLDRRTGTQHHHVGLGRLEHSGRLVGNLYADPSAQADDVAQIATDLGRVDVDATDDFEPRTRGDLLDDGRPDRTQPEVHDANVGHNLRIIARWLVVR